MRVEVFLADFRDLLQLETPQLALATPLRSLEEWDSLAAMALIAYFDRKCGKRLTFADIKMFATVGDVFAALEG